MADFKTHITTSTVLGVGYGAAGYMLLGMPLDRCMVAAGLCSVSGMLPDLDSDSGIPVRETVCFTAAIIPLLLLDRFQQFHFSREQIVLAAGLLYIGFRFGVAELFKRYTVHRGMWHSIPAAASVGLLAFLLCSGSEFDVRLYKSLATVFGFMSHLILDEIWAVDLHGRVVPRFKKSFGTALKFYGKNSWSNFSTYAKLALLIVVVVGDPIVMERYGYEERPVPKQANNWLQEVVNETDPTIRR